VDHHCKHAKWLSSKKNGTYDNGTTTTTSSTQAQKQEWQQQQRQGLEMQTRMVFELLVSFFLFSLLLFTIDYANGMGTTTHMTNGHHHHNSMTVSTTASFNSGFF
jgi:hypothetical protein